MKRQSIYIRYSIIRRRLFIILFIVLISFGVIVTSIGGYWFYSYANPPTTSFDPNYQGLEIGHNDTLQPYAMSILVNINPPELDFVYFFSVPQDGTYNFMFNFPFRVTGIISESETAYMDTKNMSIDSTSTCTVISLSLYLVAGADEAISGHFTIAPTFLSGSRGLYTVVLPFGGIGGGSSFEVEDKIQRELEVPVYTTDNDAPIQLCVTLPHSYSVTQFFPPITHMNPYTNPFNGITVRALYWNFTYLHDSVTVEYADQSQIGYYQNLNFLSGIFIGVGSSILLSSVYDGIKRLSEKAEKYVE